MGISKDLLEMPSVFERVYKMVGNKEAINLDDMIKIDEKVDYGVEQESKQETDESEDALREATEKIKQLEADNKELCEENKRLCEEMNNAQKMLRTTLDFCDKVRLSVFGHIFFRKELGKLPTSYGDDTREQ